jgi:hypothetical protein
MTLTLTKTYKKMKKFFNDNMWLFVIAAVAMAGFAIWKVTKKDETVTTMTVTE